MQWGIAGATGALCMLVSAFAGKRTLFAAVVMLATFTSASAQVPVSSPGEVAGSWRGKGRTTGTDTIIIIGADGSWTTMSKAGSESGKGEAKDGAFVITWKGGAGGMKVTKAGTDGITAATNWHYQGKWITGFVDAKRCSKPDCSDLGSLPLK